MHIKYSGNKTEIVKKLYSDMLDILVAIGIPLETLSTDRRKEKIARACLATGQVVSSLKETKSVMNGMFMKTRDIIDFENKHYSENISPGSYDDIRRKDLKILVEEGIVINSSTLDRSATNNPNRGYALDAQFASLVKASRIPVTLPSRIPLELTPGEHNLLQKKIIEDFLPIWGFGAQVLYVGDTADKYLYRDHETLASLHVFTLEHEEPPDIVAYSKEKNLLYMIEAVHSPGPMDEVRVNRLKRQLKNCTAETVFFTALLNRKMYQKHCLNIAWNTEVWIAENARPSCAS